MKSSYFLSAASCLLLLGCSKPEELPKMHANLIDSFEVRGIDIGQMVQTFNYENDTTLYNYNYETHEIVYFTRKKESKIYMVRRRDPVDAEPLSCVFEGQKKRKYIITRTNNIHLYDSATQQKLATKKIMHSFQFLKRNFMILPNHLTPVKMYDDTMVTSITYNSLDVYPDQFSENTMAEFYLGSDSVHLIRSYISRPASIVKHHLPFPMYCIDGYQVYLIYRGLDTIYHYDRHKHITTKIPINNPEYVFPGPWDYTAVFRAGYDRYRTKYDMNTFSYEGFFHDEERNLYYLFYHPPVAINMGHRQISTDQKLKVLVLDQDFKKLRISSVDKHNLVVVTSYFFIPGRGLAIPEFKGYDEFENTKFYIYTF